MRNITLVLILFALVSCAHAPNRSELDAIGKELIAMKDVDQEARRRWLKDQTNKALDDEVEAIDARNTARLLEIIKRVGGWPGKSMVGEKASGAAWTLAQHAEGSVLRELLPVMERAVKHQELDGALYATSFDRVRILDGKKQLYGSQFDTKGDKCEPMPVEDPEHLDERRIAIGLGPIADYAKQLCDVYKGSKKP
ncbi:MAG TPA: DUF6624 domain-containing protein [Thermoanaerobaculia bacterium]|nr:DUF6624 domain-containing protein [Thermoanaerobaculia bacterium]